uniref:Rad50 zinc hook motif n=1 Tax=Siphoviridae sp. ctvok7 TaxID=2827596 RepID=A0A8S5LM06_9CAUD|nr:MAG TPA: Rad50 zinc hook motif [Siphoviridae sp. ctvok7]
MTREEAIKLLKQYQGYDPMFPDGETLKHAFDLTDETVDTLLTALRPVSREQVEKSLAGCEYCEKHKINLVRIEMNYNDSPGSPKRLNPTRVPKFCPICGRPLTDEAVQMVIRRLEEMKNG